MPWAGRRSGYGRAVADRRACRLHGDRRQRRDGEARVPAEVIANREPEGLTAELFRGGDVDDLRGGVRVNALRKGGGIAHPGTTRTLRRRGHVAIEARHACHDDLIATVAAVGFEDFVADPAVDGDEHRVQGGERHGGIWNS
jgi:hypothetical protein